MTDKVDLEMFRSPSLHFSPITQTDGGRSTLHSLHIHDWLRNELLTCNSCVRPGVPVLLRVLLGAYLQGVQHGPPHGPHLRLPAGRRAGLQGHHHPAAGRGATGKTGRAGETRIQGIKGKNVLLAHPFVF